MPSTSADLAAFVPQALARVRADAPLVQCLTNSVVTGFTANVLLALGASPAMVDIPDEAGPFARIASGVLVNLGTPHAEQRSAMTEAARAAASAGTPWVLDPVAVGALPVRTALARELLGLRPAVIRGNASEIIALAGAGGGGRGVDSSDDVAAAEESARELAGRTGCVVAVSGPVDVVTDGERSARIANGHALLTRVTGGGCALGAVMAAFAAVDEDRFATTVAAVAAYTVAAEQAAKEASGPGSFAVAFLDALAALGGTDLAGRMALA
ncbi:hydroxyethylthiazole kinase [Streptomyces sp. NPDC058231]|uniref:hydroxyethylthiazole kinase n=1 Tax=unclassified Streptomyces TaxID=2593676 RepID=UPI0036EF4708